MKISKNERHRIKRNAKRKFLKKHPRWQDGMFEANLNRELAAMKRE
jgi:hypothetical protein